MAVVVGCVSLLAAGTPIDGGFAYVGRLEGSRQDGEEGKGEDSAHG
jgi:hypothetical protein